MNGIVFLGNIDGVTFEHAKNLSRDYFRLTTALLQVAPATKTHTHLKLKVTTVHSLAVEL